MGLVYCLLAVLAADFLSGLVHWWEDTYGDPAWPLLGRTVVEPNIEHHQDPLAFTRRSAWSRNYQTVLPAAAIGAALWAWQGWAWWPAQLTLLLLSWANEVHCWSHRAVNPWPIALLQEMHVLQTSRHHARHHRAPFATQFCVLTNWLNPLLERAQFWAALERLVAACGVPPKRLTTSRANV